jgi:hypothetical protein
VAYPDKRIVLWFMDEARVGQKGRLCYRWWRRGQRPPGRRDRRFEWAYLFAAVQPTTGAEVALVLPEATTRTMNLDTPINLAELVSLWFHGAAMMEGLWDSWGFSICRIT